MIAVYTENRKKPINKKAHLLIVEADTTCVSHWALNV
jgi:hypothetical protein